ncbi:MAG TPA: lipid A deacylase LpxR family protein [Burkholderiaceae bacterium]|nr:lipid A deacylase LpxR family protein [Burkholderiaceae bacterium]
MRHPLLKSVAACALTVFLVYAEAQTSRDLIDDFRRASMQGKTSIVLGIDNDSLLLNRNDGFYTSGVRIGQRHALRDTGRLMVFGWRIGQELYTASDIKLPPESIGPLDRPYAGWLYGGIFKETHRTDGAYRKFGLDIGCLGPCAGGYWMQTNLHRLLRQPQPQGWSTQLSNEFGAVLYGDMAPLRWNPVPLVDVTPNLHGRFGNIFTDVGAGITLRAGRLNLLPDEPTLHGFVRLDGSLVGYNATLQGGYFSGRNPRTVSPKRFVGEAEAGVAWIGGSYGVHVSIIRRGNEIRGFHDAAGTQNFVRLLFSYTP